jgi:uncharacterized phage protein gp47/JayE
MSSGTGWGITVNGFVMPQLSDILTEVEQTLIANFGADINLSAESFFGQIAGIFAERESLVWQAMQDVYASQNPDTAFGASLDNVGALRGIPRNPAQPSTVQNVRLFGSPGTVVPTTLQVSVQNSPTSLFSPTSAVTLGAGQNCVQTVNFSAVPASGTWQLSLDGILTTILNYNATASQVQAAIQALDFASGCTVTGNYSSGFTITFNGAGTGGLMVQPQFAVTENTLQSSVPAAITVTTAITTPGIDQGNATFECTADGPVVANAGTLTVISTPVTGLTAVLNTQDATLGSLVESDNAYRIRMGQELQVAGAGTVEAIRSQLLEVSGVSVVLVFENITDITDGSGRPPHSFEAVVNGGDTATIAGTIWKTKPAGIATYGNTSYTITDSQGISHVIYFSRPTAVPVYVIANLTVDDTYPSNGDSTVQNIIVQYINSLNIGQELIVVPKLIAQIAVVQGIQDAVLLVGTSADPTESNNITPTAYEVLTTESIFVTVNS